VQVGTISGTGPYTAPITVGGGTGGNSTLFAHTAAGGSVVSQSTHAFKQNRSFSTTWPSYSFTTNDGTEQRGWAGCVMSEMAVKIDPKGLIKVSPKFTGWTSSTQSDFVYAASTASPLPGWDWTVTNGGASSTRGLTMDLTLKRATEAIHASAGVRGPREVFAGALECDGTYKCIFENESDINLFRTYIQEPTVHTLSQPIVQFGGSTLTLTMSVSGYVTAKVSNSQTYLQLDTTMAGVANTTDGGGTGVGVIQASLTNYQSAAY
jgi:Phage tail tube protein